MPEPLFNKVEFCEICKNTFSYRTPLVAASDSVLISFYLCGNMLSTISNTVGSSNMMPKIMLI